MKVAISNQTFQSLLGNLNLPSYLLDKELSHIKKTNIAGQLLLNENIEIIQSINNKDELNEQLDNVGVFFLKEEKYVKTFTKILIKGVENILLTITEINENRELKIIQETTKALKKEVVNHSITQKELHKSRLFRDSLINSNTDMILLVDRDSKITFSNKEINRNLGYSEQELNGNYTEVIFHSNSHYKEICIELKDKKRYEGGVKLKSKQGKIHSTYLVITSYNDDTNDFLFVIKDLSDKITIKKQALKMKSIFDSGNHTIWSIDREYALTSFNENYATIFKNLYSEDPKLNQRLNTIEHRINNKTKVDFWNKKYQEAFKGNTVFFETKLEYVNDKYEYKEIYLNPIIDENGDILEVSGIGMDVTNRKQIQLKLNKNTARYNSIFQNSTVFIWSLDKELKITACNHSLEKVMLNWFNRIVTINSDFEDYYSTYGNTTAIKVFKNNFKKALNNKKQLFEISITDRFDREQFLEIYMSPISYVENEISEISCIAIDISQSKIITKQLNDSLKEKETLLQEVHHRVKNNLQIISSILNLQASYIKDENALKILKESQNRITSMSFIHESLYMNEDIRYIDFGYYIKNLTANLIQSYSITPGQIELVSEVGDIQLSLDQAIPCGLILNELISNALKYAFPDNIKGRITLVIKEKEEKVFIELRDNGIGIPSDFDIEKSESLGLQLVFILVEQLDGNIKIENNEGSNIFINFDKIKNS